MATLNESAERIAYSMGDPFNVMLRENIKFSIKECRSLLIRRDIAQNGLSDEFNQKIKIPLVKIDRLDDCDIEFGCEALLKSQFKIPKPIRVKADCLFKYVGVIDLQGNQKPATYVELEEFRYTKFNRYTSNVLRYTYLNEYLCFFNNTFLKFAFINTPWADPSKVNIACGEECYNDDMEFPCSMDMMKQIRDMILGGEFPLKTPPVNYEVGIEKEI